MKKIKIYFVVTVFLFLSQNVFAICGTYNYGALPNEAYKYCLGATIPMYSFCGNQTGILTGLKDHPLMCTSTWSNMNLDTTEVCAGEKVVQSATLNGTTRSRNVYSRNQGWIWNPKRNTVPIDEEFTQTSNCGATRIKTGTLCDDTGFAPHPDTYCDGEIFTQYEICGDEEQQAIGTKDCSSNPEIENGGADTLHGETIWMTTSQGDEGYFQFNGTGQNNETILYNQRRETIIRRYRSAAGDPYRMWIDDNQEGGFGVNLKDRESYDVWLNFMDLPKNPNMHWCELVESTWTGWTPVDPLPTTCGEHTIVEERTCGVQGAVRPCPISCSNGSDEQTETRTRTIDNGACACVPDAWTPSPEGVCSNQQFTQSDGCDTRLTWGTQSCSCTSSTWSPARDTVCYGVVFDQTSNCGTNRTNIGTKDCSALQPTCGTLHGKKFYVGSQADIKYTEPFSATSYELCAEGATKPNPYFDGTGVDGLISWGCIAGGNNKFCYAQITCDNLGSSPCTLDRN